MDGISMLTGLAAPNAMSRKKTKEEPVRRKVEDTAHLETSPKDSQAAQRVERKDRDPGEGHEQRQEEQPSVYDNRGRLVRAFNLGSKI